jgi:hypothetical protein
MKIQTDDGIVRVKDLIRELTQLDGEFPIYHDDDDRILPISSIEVWKDQHMVILS